MRIDWKFMKKRKAIPLMLTVALIASVGVAAGCKKKKAEPAHEHTFATEWSKDDVGHWYGATCEHTDEKSGYAEHEYDNACDTKCNVCDAEREIEHEYDNACDTKCNVCDAEREIEHAYDNACDTKCNVCDAEREIEHDYKDTLTAGKTYHWYECEVCGEKKDEAEHEFTKEIASNDTFKQAATETTKAQYWKSCECGAISTTVYFETDKLPANLQVEDISKVYDGTPVLDPSVTFDGVGAENFAYYKGNEKLTVRPTNAGTYKVVVTVDETETHAADRVEQEFTIAKKTLNYLELTKVYDGKGVLDYALGTEHGVVAGDTVLFYCDEAPDYIVGTYKLIPYDDQTAIDDPGADDRAFLAGEDAANYTFEERIEGKYKLCATITVTKREVWVTGVKFEYYGDSYYDDESIVLSTIHNAVSADENDLRGYFKLTFDNSNVGSNLISVELDDEDFALNYAVNFSKCSGEIVKRPVWAENAKFTYDGCDIFCGDEYPVFTLQNVVSGETIDLGDVSWYFDSKNVGATLIDVNLSEEYNPNYTIDFSKCSAEIVKRELWVTGATFIYDGWDRLCDDESTTERTIYNAANKDDEWYMGGYFTFIFENSNAGAQLQGVELSYPDLEGNYEINVSKCEAKIVSKEIEVPTTASFEYVKNDQKHDIVFENVRSNEFLALTIYFRDDAVGASKYAIENSIYYSDKALSVKTKDEMLNNYSPKGYTDWDAYKEAIYAVAEITPRLIDLPQEQITKVYDQTANFNYDYTVASTHDWLNISFKAVDAENNALNQAGEYAGVNVQDVVISINGGLETDNYALRATEGVANVKITPIVLDVKDLYFNYPPSFNYTSIEIRLGTSVGVLEGDIARLQINFGNTKPNNNSDISLEDATSVHIYAENNAKTNKNYVLPEDISAITLHTSTFETIAVDASTLEGYKSFGSTLSKKGVFAVTLPEDGSYNFTCTAENTSNIYDGNGNKMIIGDNSSYVGLKAGTYYWHYSISSNFINVKFMVTKVVAKGERNNPKIIAFNTDTKIAEDKNLDWHGLDEYWYKVSLQVGWYSVGQKGLKVSVLDGSWNTYATLVGEFQITSAGQYLIYINKADNAELYDTVTRFSLVSHSISDNAEAMYEDPGAQGVFVSDHYTLSEDNHIFFFDYDPYWNITKTVWFALIVYDGTSWDNVIASYKFYDSDHKEVNISWDGEQLSFPSGYSEEDQLYLVVTFREAAYGKTIYLEAY